MFVWGGSHRELIHQSIWKKEKTFKVSFIKALKPCMQAWGRKRFQGKWASYKGIFKREPVKGFLFCPAKCHMRLRGEQEARTFGTHLSASIFWWRNQTIVSRVCRSQKQTVSLQGGNGHSHQFHDDEYGPVTGSVTGERRRAGECSSFLLLLFFSAQLHWAEIVSTNCPLKASDTFPLHPFRIKTEWIINIQSF